MTPFVLYLVVPGTSYCPAYMRERKFSTHKQMSRCAKAVKKNTFVSYLKMSKAKVIP